MKRIDYQGLASALEEAAWSVDGMWTEELEPRAVAWTLTQLGKERDELIEDHKRLADENEKLRHRINLATLPAKELLAEAERNDQPGYRWPRLAAEQVVDALTEGVDL